MNASLQASLDRLLAQMRARVGTHEPTFLCRCGSYFNFRAGKEVPVGWVFTSTERNAPVRKCEVCERGRPRPVAGPEREASFQ